MPDLTTSADVDAFMAAANNAAARTSLGLTTLATTTPGTGVVTALGTNTNSAGSIVVFNGQLGSPSSVGTMPAFTLGGTISGGGNQLNNIVIGSTTPLAGTFTTLVAGSATSLLVGTAGSAVGSVGFRNATSGTITLAPTTGALGTVTQTLQAVTGTVYCTGGTDVAVADGGTGLSSGTSGGVLAYTASGTLASSGALAANAIVIGGGAGAVPSTTTTGTGVLTALGVATNAGGGVIALADPGADRIVFWDDSGNAFTHLTVGSGLDITGTTLTATGAGGTAVTAASAAAGSGLFWVSAGADRSATATDTVTTLNATNLNASAVLPTTNDGAALGASGTAFSDLFLASGAVINFNAGNLTLTHSAGTLTSNGAYVGTTGTFSSTTSLLLGTAGSAVGNIGFRNATSGTITVAPTTGALGTVTQTLQAVTGTILCTGGTDVPVADGGTGLSSGTSGGILGFTASGTLASSAALAANAIVIGGGAGATPTTTTTGTGVLTALGVNVGSAGAFITFNGAGGTPSSMVGTNITGLAPANIVAGTLGGTITLGEGTQQIALDPALSADGTYSGIIVTGTSGYAQTIGDLVYLDPTDSRWEAADANSASGADGDARGNLAMVVVAGTDGNSCTLLLRGRARFASFPAGMTINNPLYVSETAGAITQTQPTTTDVVIRIIGHATTADEINFCPDNLWITHV